MGTSTERTGGISIVDGGKDIATGEDEMDRGDGVGNEEPLDGRVCLGSQSSAWSEEREQVVHPGVAMLEGRVFGEED